MNIYRTDHTLIIDSMCTTVC